MKSERLNSQLNLSILCSVAFLSALVSCSEPGSNELSNKKPDWIFWSEKYKLSWSDFQGELIGAENFAAYTSSGLIKNYSISSDSIIVTVEAIFVKDSSYVDLRRANANMLAHEQGHFDLAEVFARLLRSEVSSEVCGENFDSWFQYKFDSIGIALRRKQRVYDIETANGTDLEVQKKWQANIDSLLEVYDRFEIATLRKAR